VKENFQTKDPSYKEGEGENEEEELECQDTKAPSRFLERIIQKN
jgi:hypothetical protein